MTWIELKFDKSSKPHKLVDLRIGEEFVSLPENERQKILEGLGRDFQSMLEEEPQSNKKFDIYLIMPGLTEEDLKEVK